MISVLVVGTDGQDLSELEGIDSSVEVLLACGMEDALEKLGRNRRVDAVLLVTPADAGEILEALREDSPAHPPIYVPAGWPRLPGTIALPAEEAPDLLNLLKSRLQD